MFPKNPGEHASHLEFFFRKNEIGINNIFSKSKLDVHINISIDLQKKLLMYSHLSNNRGGWNKCGGWKY